MAYPAHTTTEIAHFLAQSSSSALIIETDNEGVEINLADEGLRFHHNFISGPLSFRAGQPGQAIVKACSNKQRNIKEILDLTTGWGIDALTLARHGKRVTMLEQNDLVCAATTCSGRDSD